MSDVLGAHGTVQTSPRQRGNARVVRGLSLVWEVRARDHREGGVWVWEPRGVCGRVFASGGSGNTE